MTPRTKAPSRLGSSENRVLSDGEPRDRDAACRSRDRRDFCPCRLAKLVTESTLRPSWEASPAGPSWLYRSRTRLRSVGIHSLRIESISLLGMMGRHHHAGSNRGEKRGENDPGRCSAGDIPRAPFPALRARTMPSATRDTGRRVAGAEETWARRETPIASCDQSRNLLDSRREIGRSDPQDRGFGSPSCGGLERADTLTVHPVKHPTRLPGY